MPKRTYENAFPNNENMTILYTGIGSINHYHSITEFTDIIHLYFVETHNMTLYEMIIFSGAVILKNK